MLRAPYARGVNLGMNCFIPHGVNGTVDSLRYMFNIYSHDNRNTVKMLLRSYLLYVLSFIFCNDCSIVW